MAGLAGSGLDRGGHAARRSPVCARLLEDDAADAVAVEQGARLLHGPVAPRVRVIVRPVE